MRKMGLIALLIINWDYKLTLLTGIEEFMEMTGIAILIYGQILYLSEHESIKVKSIAA